MRVEVAGDEVGREERLAGPHPVAVAGQGVDLPVVGHVAVRVGQRPAGEGVGREARVHQRQARLEPRVLEVGEELAQLLGGRACPCRRASGTTARGSTARRPRARPACAARRPGARGPAGRRRLRRPAPGPRRAAPCAGMALRAVSPGRRVGPARRASPSTVRPSSAASASTTFLALAASSTSVGRKARPDGVGPGRRQGEAGRLGRAGQETVRAPGPGSRRRPPSRPRPPTPRGGPAARARSGPCRRCRGSARPWRSATMPTPQASCSYEAS